MVLEKQHGPGPVAFHVRAGLTATTVSPRGPTGAVPALLQTPRPPAQQGLHAPDRVQRLARVRLLPFEPAEDPQRLSLVEGVRCGVAHCRSDVPSPVASSLRYPGLFLGGATSSCGLPGSRLACAPPFVPGGGYGLPLVASGQCRPATRVSGSLHAPEQQRSFGQIRPPACGTGGKGCGGGGCQDCQGYGGGGAGGCAQGFRSKSTHGAVEMHDEIGGHVPGAGQVHEACGGSCRGVDGLYAWASLLLSGVHAQIRGGTQLLRITAVNTSADSSSTTSATGPAATATEC